MNLLIPPLQAPNSYGIDYLERLAKVIKEPGHSGAPAEWLRGKMQEICIGKFRHGAT